VRGLWQLRRENSHLFIQQKNFSALSIQKLEAIMAMSNKPLLIPVVEKEQKFDVS